MKMLSLYEEQVYALLRIVVGFLFCCHGLQKIFGLFGGAPAEMPLGLLWTAGLIELVAGALVALGAYTRPAAFLASGLMAVAYLMAHQAQGLLPIVNRGELAVLYAWAFLYIATRGDGIWSVGAIVGQGGLEPA